MALPLFVTMNVTLPAFALFFVSVNLSVSSAETLTVVTCVWLRAASTDEAPIPTTTASAANAAMRRRTDIKDPPKERKIEPRNKVSAVREPRQRYAEDRYEECKD